MDPVGLKKLAELKTVTMISITDCEIKKLEPFPAELEELEVLELADNKLSGDSLKALASLKKLSFLALGGNEKIKLDDVKALSSLPLKELDLMGCAAGDDEFRPAIFETFKELEVLNGKDQDGNEIEEDEALDEEDFDDDELDEDEYDEDE